MDSVGGSFGRANGRVKRCAGLLNETGVELSAVSFTRTIDPIMSSTAVVPNEHPDGRVRVTGALKTTIHAVVSVAAGILLNEPDGRFGLILPIKYVARIRRTRIGTAKRFPLSRTRTTTGAYYIRGPIVADYLAK